MNGITDEDDDDDLDTDSVHVKLVGSCQLSALAAAGLRVREHSGEPHLDVSRLDGRAAEIGRQSAPKSH